MEVHAMSVEGDIFELTVDVISCIWPSTTQATFFSPKGVGSDESDFHQGRLKLAEGKKT
jgi:hypothetical protein